jgi:hypothetical protein
VYQATVTTQTNGVKQAYVGLTENTFKTRYTNHVGSFRHKSKHLSTELSKHIWQLKDNNQAFDISWKVIKQAAPYNNATKNCNLCQWEKYFIVCRPELSSLNKRNKFVSALLADMLRNIY